MALQRTISEKNLKLLYKELLHFDNELFKEKAFQQIGKFFVNPKNYCNFQINNFKIENLDNVSNLLETLISLINLMSLDMINDEIDHLSYILGSIRFQ